MTLSRRSWRFDERYLNRNRSGAPSPAVEIPPRPDRARTPYGVVVLSVKVSVLL
jgi:hypothetical protein